jgi:hypothetical protein
MDFKIDRPVPGTGIAHFAIDEYRAGRMFQAALDDANRLNCGERIEYVAREQAGSRQHHHRA